MTWLLWRVVIRQNSQVVRDNRLYHQTQFYSLWMLCCRSALLSGQAVYLCVKSVADCQCHYQQSKHLSPCTPSKINPHQAERGHLLWNKQVLKALPVSICRFKTNYRICMNVSSLTILLLYLERLKGHGGTLRQTMLIQVKIIHKYNLFPKFDCICFVFALFLLF